MGLGYVRSFLGEQYDRKAGRRARHGAGPQTVAGSYPDSGGAPASLLAITDRRILSCPLKGSFRGGSPWVVPIVTGTTWHVDRHRLVRASEIRPRLPVIIRPALRLEFDDTSVLDLEVVPYRLFTTSRRELQRLISALAPHPE